MSLINDALRRSQQAQPEGAAKPAAGPALHPVETPGRIEREGNFLLPALIVAAVLTAGILLWAGSGAGGDVKVRARTSETTLPAPIVTTPTPAPVAPVELVATAPIPAVAETVSSNAVLVEPSKPEPPAYKLQAIFVKRTSIAAVVNGKTVSVGDRVGDARVTAMDRESVTLVTEAGQRKYLELPY